MKIKVLLCNGTTQIIDVPDNFEDLRCEDQQKLVDEAVRTHWDEWELVSKN